MQRRGKSRVESNLGKMVQRSWSRAEQRFIPPYAWQSDPLSLWRERILFSLLFIAFALGPLALIPSLTLAFSERLWGVILLDSAAYAAVIALLFSRGLSMRLRGWIFCLIVYTLGLGLLFLLGWIGAGYIWLLGASVMMATLLGFQATLWSLAINAVGLAAVATFIVLEDPGWAQPVDNALNKWMVMAANFLLINAIVTITTALMLRHLKKALLKEQDTSRDLRRSEARYRALIEDAPLGILSVDHDGRVVDINGKLLEIIGSPSREVALDTNLFTFAPATETGFARDVRECLQQGRTRSRETTYVVRKGHQVFLRYHLRPLPPNRGQESAVLGMVEDITREQRQAEKLRRAQKMEAVGVLAGGVAHDLNNILSGLVSYPELVLLDLDDDSPLREPLSAIKSSGEKAAEIVQDLLTLARRGVAAKKVTDLNRIVNDFIASPAHRRRLAGHPHIRLEVDLSEDLLNLSGSEVHLSKTVMNLVTNAADAMPGGGAITIKTFNAYIDKPYRGFERIPEGEYTILEISDMGIGMSPADLEHIFEPFYTKKAMGRSGSGLGMSVVWGTVRDHEGHIDIDTEEGRGTTFRLYFLVTRLEKPLEATVYLQDYIGRGESVLIVDDVPEQRALAGRMLQRLGYKISTAASGREALEMSGEKRFDLVVLDMIMPPGRDGLETYRGMLDLRPHQKAIVASGYSENDRVREMQRLGAGAYVKKPYTLEKIGLAVRQELDRPQTSPPAP